MHSARVNQSNKIFCTCVSCGLGLRPQHPQDMLQNADPGGLPSTLCDFVNMVLAGGVPPVVRHDFFGASSHALKQ